MGEGGGACACYGVLRCALPSPAKATPTSVQAPHPPSLVLSDYHYHGDDDYYRAMLRQGLDGTVLGRGTHVYRHLVTALHLAKKANFGEGIRTELFGMLTGIM